MRVMGLATLNNNRHFIDTMHDGELYAHLDNEDDQTKYCADCGRPIAQNEEYYLLDDVYYCYRCDGTMRDRVNDFLADLLGYHVSDEALDAIMADCERVGY